MTRLSVAVIAYNQEAVVGDCLRSLLAQAVDVDFELVVADDGSTDGTAAAIRRAVKGATVPVRILGGEPNLGITRNVNRALRACTGELVALLGGDDLAYPGKLAAQAAHLDAHPQVTLSYHDMEEFWDDPGRPRTLYSQRFPPREGPASELVRHGNFVAGSSAMVRRDALPPGGLPEAIAWASDWVMNIEVAARGSVAYLPRVLGGYRRSPGGAMLSGRAALDPWLTLAYVEARHPHLAADAQWQRAVLLRAAAQQRMDAGDAAAARAYAKAALRLRSRWPRPDRLWLSLAARGWLPSQRRARRA
jgi:glycosyltransferase involved in cell wall biosynthesis